MVKKKKKKSTKKSWNGRELLELIKGIFKATSLTLYLIVTRQMLSLQLRELDKNAHSCHFTSALFQRVDPGQLDN